VGRAPAALSGGTAARSRLLPPPVRAPREVI
jgi:hypothetical protein